MPPRSHREVRKQKIVRNVTIFCGSLVILVMILERGILSSTEDTSTSQPSQYIKPDISHHIKSTSPPLFLDDNDDVGSKFAPSSEQDEDEKYDNDKDEDNLTGNHIVPGSTEHEDPIPATSSTPSDPLTNNNQNNLPSQDQHDHLSPNNPDPQDRTSPNSPLDPIFDTNPLNSSLSSSNANSSDSKSAFDSSSQSDTLPTSLSLTSDSSPATIPSLATSPPTLDPTLSPSANPSDTPYTDLKDEDDDHSYDESDDDHSHYPSDDVPTVNIVDDNLPTSSPPSGPTTGSITLTSPTDPTLDPVAAEKLKKKERQNAENAILENKVKREYADEISGVKSNVTFERDPASLLMPRPLLFLHIPKTAGSTLAQVFKANAPSGKYFHFWNQPRVTELHLVPDKEVIFGHFRYGIHFYMPNQTAYYATMLREPVERVISYYYFHLQDTQDPAHKFAKEHTFEEWLEESPAAQNEMTKSLSGIRSEFYPSTETFEIAKHHLRSMRYVGLTERFDNSLALMKYYFGFKDLSYDKTKVGVKKPHDLDEKVREKIREKNRMDIELYEIAKEIFEAEMNDLSKYLLLQEMKL